MKIKNNKLGVSVMIKSHAIYIDKSGDWNNFLEILSSDKVSIKYINSQNYL